VTGVPVLSRTLNCSPSLATWGEVGPGDPPCRSRTPWRRETRMVPRGWLGALSRTRPRRSQELKSSHARVMRRCEVGGRRVKRSDPRLWQDLLPCCAVQRRTWVPATLGDLAVSACDTVGDLGWGATLSVPRAFGGRWFDPTAPPPPKKDRGAHSECRSGALGVKRARARSDRGARSECELGVTEGRARSDKAPSLGRAGVDTNGLSLTRRRRRIYQHSGTVM
jgi:hypothetical protein